MPDDLLQVTLPAEVAAMVRAQVASGAFATDSEVVGEALRLWAARLDAVKAGIEAAVADPVRVDDAAVGAHFAALAARARAGR